MPVHSTRLSGRRPYETLRLLCLAAAAAATLLRAPPDLRAQTAKNAHSPPTSVKPSDADLASILSKMDHLAAALKTLRDQHRPDHLIADVEIYHKAADWIVRHGEFYNASYVAATLRGLDRGLARAADLTAGRNPWATQTGRVTRAYRSKIDGSVQPYALIIPDSYTPDPAHRWRLDINLHGRGATLNEVSFIDQHDKPAPVPADQDFIQLDVFGRTNNAYRFAGESDVFEALESVRRHYRIDDRRIVLRGFSMGGAGAWHLGLHYPDRWRSVGPGAGFTDTKRYQKITAPLPAQQEATLHIYDAVDYSLNASGVPIVAYGGELDPQLAASVQIKDALETLGFPFSRAALGWRATSIPFELLVGPQTPHRFHPDSLKQAMAFHARHSAGTGETLPKEIRFVTYTLKYNRCFWITIEELEHHYQRSTVEARITPDGNVEAKTAGVTVLAVAREAGQKITLDGQTFDLAQAADSLLPDVYFRKARATWQQLDYEPSRQYQTSTEPRKRPGLQGPIDDAFMEPFLCVRPTAKPWSRETDAYARWTLDRFGREWDKWLRGQLPVKDDTEITDDDIRRYHLVLFGDPASNRLIARVLGAPGSAPPISWSEHELKFAGRTYSSATHVPALIYPNPLNPHRYVVINSGHTFHDRQFRASNAQLYPRLGDYAVLAPTPDSRAGFTETLATSGLFDERWQFPAQASPGSPASH